MSTFIAAPAVSRHRRVRHCLAFLAAATPLLSGCRDLLPPAPPASAAAEVSLSITTMAGVESAYSRVNRVAIRLAREGGPEFLRVLEFPPSGGEVRLTIQLTTPQETAQLAVELLRDDAALFRAGTEIVLRAGEATEALLDLRPVAAAVSVQRPVPEIRYLGDEIQLAGVVLFATGDTIPGLALSWQTLDPSVVEASPSGVVVANAAGEARVEGRFEQLADTVRVQVAGITFGRIASGVTHTCALTTAGRLYCWGSNALGQLGTGDTAPRNVPTEVSTPLTFAALSAGDDFTCALTTAGRAYCWGDNTHGQLGTGDTNPQSSPREVSTSLTFATVSTGDDHSCALTPAGRAYCWGRNLYGQLGTGDTRSLGIPRAVGTELAFATLSAGASHTCALTTARRAYCWGRNDNGQLGLGPAFGSSFLPTPVEVSTREFFTALDAGAEHNCALTAAGQAYCWGDNSAGQLGLGVSAGSQNAPVEVRTSLAFAAVSSGPGSFSTCALTPAGRAYCWGRNDDGQLGIGAETEPQNSPREVVTTLTFSAVDLGSRHTCALTAVGRAYCWGSNASGELGTGDAVSRSTPAAVK